MNQNHKIIIIIISTFALAMLTSLLLEIPIFKHWLRQTIVILFILLQFFLGYTLITYLIKSKK